MRRSITRGAAGLVFGALLVGSGGCALPWTTRDDGQRLQRQLDDTRAQLAKVQAKNDELAKQLDDRIRRLDEALDRATLVVQRNSADLGLTVEKMQEEMGKVEGRLDDVTHSTDALGRQVSDWRAASDTKIDQLQAALATAQGPPIPDTADAVFAEADKRIAAQQWKDARRLLEAFLNRYPTDPRAAKAQFLVGEAYAAEGRWANAIGAYTKVFDEHPRADVEPDAMYKCGLAFQALKYCGDARVYFQELLKRHPETKWKKDAKQQLEIIARQRSNRAACNS